MKVLCIDDGKRDFAEGDCLLDITVGECYTVIDTFHQDGCYLYELSGIPGFGWQAVFFIPLSNIDERELVKERE